MNFKQICAGLLLVMVTGMDAAAVKESQTAAKGYELVKAAYRGDVQRVKELIAQGVDVNARDEQGWTALIEVANKGNSREGQEIMEFLLAIPSIDVNAESMNGRTALTQAAYLNQTKVIPLLLNHTDAQKIKALRTDRASYLNTLPADVSNLIFKYRPIYSISDQEAEKVIAEAPQGWIEKKTRELIRKILAERVAQ